MKALVLALLLLFPLTSSSVERDTHQELFEYACKYTEYAYGYNCDGLEAPTVVLSKVVFPMYYGFYYHGESYIFVNPRINTRQQDSTIVHETVHYILDHKEAGFSRCESEEAARYAHHSYERSEYNDNWRKGYKCLN